MTKEVINFGCRLNAYESEVIKDFLTESTDNDLIVVNTCAVTNEAERQARQAVRKINRENPNKKIIVTGCAAQINPKQFSNMPGVIKILGNQEKMESHSYSNDFIHNEEKIIVNDIMSIKETASHLVSSFEGKIRAFVQVQNGCNHRCTFCSIPYARGNSRSVPVGEIANQIKLLVKNGYKEIVLTGVDISDYGLDLPGQPTLAQLIKRLLALIPDLYMLRISSIDVAEINEELFHLLAYEHRIAPHIHISLQSGDNMILKRMKRRHNREQVINFCNKLRSLRPGIAFGADIIVGFPTETEEMFNNTLNLVKEADLQYLHVFPYSEREGTPASRMPQIAKNIRKQRALILREAGKTNLKNYLLKQIGKIQQVIIEKEKFARATNFSAILLAKDVNIGDIVNVEIVDIEQSSLNLIGNIV